MKVRINFWKQLLKPLSIVSFLGHHYIIKANEISGNKFLLWDS